MKNKINVSPSIMCADLVNLENSIHELENLGFDMLHIDILDGNFSPSMPLGIDTIRRLREITDMRFDIHIMTTNNDFFIKEMLEIGVYQITFHLETALHTDRLIRMIKEAGVKVGIGINPATNLTGLQYILPEIDTILLMLINPGFASNKCEQQVPYAMQKIRDCKAMISTINGDINLEVDGRVSLDTIPNLIRFGADTLVVGSTGLFIKGQSLETSFEQLEQSIEEGLRLRNE